MAGRLSLSDVNLHFGGVKVLQQVGFDVEPGESLIIIGSYGGRLIVIGGRSLARRGIFVVGRRSRCIVIFGSGSHGC